MYSRKHSSFTLIGIHLSLYPTIKWHKIYFTLVLFSYFIIYFKSMCVIYMCVYKLYTLISISYVNFRKVILKYMHMKLWNERKRLTITLIKQRYLIKYAKHGFLGILMNLKFCLVLFVVRSTQIIHNFREYHYLFLEKLLKM